jgi:hypothetical protein
MAMDPSSRPSVSRYLLVTVAFLLLSTTLVLLAMNAYLLQTKGKTITAGVSGKDTYRQGYLAARASLKTFCPVIDAPATAFSGTIVSVSGSTVVVRQTTLAADPAIDGVSNDRKVMVGANTAIVSLVAKDPGALAAEMAAAKPGNPLPAPNTEARRSLSDLKPGTTITVEATNDIRLQPNIQAARIILP